ncbi:MAG: LrgB family protein [Clostridia bacterium]|nr:LrgB family protein [Clostridia bacterium]
MNEFVESSLFFGAFVSVGAYMLGTFVKNKLKLAILNPLLIAIALVIALLLAGKIDYNTYNASAKYLSWLLTPATVCLAIPLYQQLEVLKKNLAAILCGITAGSVAGMASVLGLAVLFGLSHGEYVTFLPKSITTAIGMGVSEELGGVPAITVAVIILTGIQGNIMAPAVLKLLRITHPVAKGLAIGTASHAIGTTKAMELGETEGAMSGLAIAVAGLITVVFAGFFAGVY